MLQTFDSRNTDLQININGELFHRNVAGISPFDSAVQGGDGVWEGLRLYNGKIFKLEEHLKKASAFSEKLEGRLANSISASTSLIDFISLASLS